MKSFSHCNGGREHALASKAAQSPPVDTVLPQRNAGTALVSLQNAAIGVTDIPALLNFAQNERRSISTTGRRGPEAPPLVIGVVDAIPRRWSEDLAQTEGPRNWKAPKRSPKISPSP